MSGPGALFPRVLGLLVVAGAAAASEGGAPAPREGAEPALLEFLAQWEDGDAAWLEAMVELEAGPEADPEADDAPPAVPNEEEEAEDDED